MGGPPEPLGLAWLALWALPAGVLAAGLGRAALLPPLGWAAVVCTAPTGPWAAPALAGLFSAGCALGHARPATRVGDSGVALLVLALLAGLPALGGLTEPAPWSPALTARLLDLSPVVLVVESAGVDWLRHPAVYGPAGGDALGPDLRGPWSGALAGPVLLLVGCALLAATVARRAPRPA